MADDLTLRRFLRDHYGAKPYALLVGEHTVTNIARDRLPFLIATILIHHAGGRHSAHAVVDQAAEAMERIERNEPG